ncbi:MAG: dipeptidase PepV [Thermoanaerobacteraceae bacterium]|nr:dipeptidase PepV [Thermoanaerobacteraceae bacterium]
MDIEQVIASNEKQLLTATSEIIKIKSVKDTPLQGMPFGEGPAKALNYALNLAKGFGLETKNLDNYAGWAQWGEGDEMIGILVHLDVVPEGSGWTFPPYGGQIHDGKIYGRGAIDDKGPAMAALFALKSLKDAGTKFSRRVRVIFGTDEESGSECMEYYLKHDEAPTMGFSPDANYPIINGEKGMLTFSFTTLFDGEKGNHGTTLLSFKGGHRSNMVPDYAEAHIIGNIDEINDLVNSAENTIPGNFKVEQKNGEIVIKSYGISAHASTPERGKNACMLLAKLLANVKLTKPHSDFIEFLNNRIGLGTTGRGLGIDFKDDISGELTFNVGILECDENKATVTVNIRYPIKYKGEQIIEQIRKNVPESIQIENISDNKPHYVPEDNLIIHKLKYAYEKVTGEKAYCFSIGGGTYARMFKNCVAFGPNFPGKPELAHHTDEYIEVEDLFKNLWIYTYVMNELIK